MKHLFLILFCVSCLFVSCSEEANDLNSFGNSNSLVQNEYDKLLNNIDEVNAKYSIPMSIYQKGNNGKVNKWGGKILSAVVDGLSGYISGPAGWIVGPLASWAFDAQWERCNRAVRPGTGTRPKKALVNDSIVVPTYVPDTRQPQTFADSIGYYHNMILSKLDQSCGNYYENDSTVNYVALYSGCEKASKELSVNIPKVDDKDKYIQLAKYIVSQFSECNSDSLVLDGVFDRINSYYFDKFNADSSMVLTEKLQKKLASVLNNLTDEETIQQYANDVYNAIYESNVSLEMKDNAFIANSVMTNSKLYWEKQR